MTTGDIAPRVVKSVTPITPAVRTVTSIKPVQVAPKVVKSITPVQPSEAPVITPTPNAPSSGVITKGGTVTSPFGKSRVEQVENYEANKPSTADDIKKSPEDMKKIREYMVKRKGVQFSDMPDDELYDYFVSQMRWFNANEISTLGELRWITNAKEEDKIAASEAYGVYDKLGNFMGNDGVLGALGGAKDYALSTLLSPSTYIGAGVGKLVAGSASKLAAREAVKLAAEGAAKMAAKEAAKRGVKGGALTAIRREAYDKVIADAAKTTAIKQAGVATGIDAVSNVGSNVAYQDVMTEAGNQDSFSVASALLAGTLGVIGGAVSYAPQAARGISGLEDTAVKFKAGRIAAQKVATKKVVPAAVTMAKTFAEKMGKWAPAVANGEVLTDSVQFQKDVMGVLLGREQLPDGTTKPSLLEQMVIDAGVTMDNSIDAPGVMEQVVNMVSAMTKKDKAKLDKIMKPVIGIGFGDAINIMASTLKAGGSSLNMASQFANNMAKVVKAKTEAEQILKQDAEDLAKAKQDPRYFEYAQSMWRRALVSHPATTLVNLKGWGITNAFTLGSQIAQAAVLGGIGVLGKMAPVGALGRVSDEALRRSGRTMQALVFSARTMFDPYTTKEAAEALFKQIPERHRKMLGESTFGVDTKNPERYGLNPDNKVVKSVENIASTASNVSGMQIQDTFTKSISFIEELNRLVLLKYNKTLSKMLDEGSAHTIDDSIYKQATEKALQDSFSMNYTKGYGHLSSAANLIENLSNTPGLGFIFPFGRFMNNAMAFSLQYSPLGVMPLVSRMVKKGIVTEKALTHLGSQESIDTMAKATVGTIAIATLAMIEGDKQKQGLSWNQELDDTGAIVDRSNLAPISSYRALGRLAYNFMTGQHVSPELMTDVAQQLTVGQIFRNMNANGIADLAKYMLTLNDDEAAKADFGKMLGETARFIGGNVASGFTRPLDFPNALTHQLLDNDYQIDRKQLKGGEGAVADTFRYIDSIFSPFLTPDENGRQMLGPPAYSINKPGIMRDANPVGRVFGTKEELPLTNLDRLLGSVNLPAWSQSEASAVPEWNSMVHKQITGILEQRATALIKSEAWQKASQRARYVMVKTLITETKKDVRAMVAGQGYKGMSLDAQRKFLSKDENLRIEAKKYFDLQDTPDDQLTPEQIDALTYWITETQKYRKTLVK